ncbi:hypothetical protein [Pseudoxanthomonas indica]|uniref:Transmembrane protein n=1 Tax=Pseudoxanthomonas indica TaxID=428993 RepID=A0A1T5K3A3_9GAMM|nr:hypothetical protein [Pseudoxanthomonas indica]GGD46240.1 hypothetical protein GCM10007235_17790 [Pseudoxanthomonas indica]SKC58050.1 hypothetical protein SAMN06296058_1317 [Pseudoxanthomonas indica]
MNLPLHFGFLGALEAGLIAFLIGLLVYAGWQAVCRALGWSIGHAIGWSCVFAALIGAGVDSWNMFYLGMMKLESPLYARIALQAIHDPDALGARVICELVGAGAGVVMGWQWFSRGHAKENVLNDREKTRIEH